MSEGTQGLVIFFGLTLASSLLWHWALRSYGVAVLAATVTTVVLFQVAAYVKLGYLDPFFLVAMATSAAMALAISAVVGLPFRSRRKQRGMDADAP